MFPGCTGLGHMIRISFVLLLYPMSWSKKCYLFFPSLLIIIFASTIHFLLLIPIAYHYPDWFAFAHNYFTKILFFGFIFLCWLIWEKAIPLRRIKLTHQPSYSLHHDEKDSVFHILISNHTPKPMAFSWTAWCNTFSVCRQTYTLLYVCRFYLSGIMGMVRKIHKK